MKIMIVSDSHGRCFYLEKAYRRVKPVDMIIHLGDLEGDADYVKSFAECPVYMVAGNNDFFVPLPRDLMINIGKYKVFLTHGNKYGVNYGVDTIKEAAGERGADIVMFGHTHIPLIDVTGEIWAVNPGSITLPRQEGRIPTFIIMDIDRFGDAHFTLEYEDDKFD